MTERNSERREFYARQMCILNCAPGNFDCETGEPASIISLGSIKDGSVQPLVIDLRDSRRLALKLLVSLATYDDRLAQRVLDELFPADDGGNFYWPHRDSGV